MGVVRWVLRVVGVLMVLLGIGGMVVGRGGVVWSPATQVAVGPGVAVATSPGVTAYRGGRLAVEASVPSGSVLVGVAHPVDVRSWLGGATHSLITSVGPGGLQTRVVAAAEGATPPVAAEQARFWTDSASGPTRQSLRIPLDGSPTQVVVLASEATTVDIRVGLVAPALRGLSVGAIVLGLALVAGSFARRSSRGGSPSPDVVPAQPALLTGVVSPMAESEPEPGSGNASSGTEPVPGSGEASPGTVTARGTAASRALLAVLLVPVLGACGVVPERAEAWKASEVTKTALTPAELPAHFEDYDRRNNAAIIDTAKSGDPKAWATADAEVLLDIDQFHTHRSTIAKENGGPFVATHRPDKVWAYDFGTYPMFAITSATLQVNGKAVLEQGQSVPNPDLRSVDLWLHGSATDLWRSAGSATTTTDLPEALPAGESAAPSVQDREAALSGAEAIMAFLRTAKEGGVAADPSLSHLATGGSVPGAPGHRVSIDWYKPGAKEQVSVDGSVRAVRVQGGVLAHASFVGREVYVDSVGLLKWTDPAYAKALGQEGERRELSRPIGVSVFYLVGADKKVRVLASRWDVVR